MVDKLKKTFIDIIDLICWFLLLIIVSTVISYEFIAVSFFFVLYTLELCVKFFLNCFFLKEVKPIQYRNFLYVKNTKLKFIFFYMYDFPIKWAFHYFYSIFKFFIGDEKKSFPSLKLNNYKIIFNILKIIFFRFIFKIITTFSYLAYVNTNYIYDSFYDLKNHGINNKNVFFNTLLLNIMVCYNSIFLKIKNHRVIIKNKKIQFNPPKLFKKLLNLVDKEVLNRTELNIGVNDLSYLSQLSIKSHNTSIPQITVTTKIDDYYSLNQTFSKNGNENDFDSLKYQLELKDDIELRSNSFFDSLNKKFKTEYSGYNEKDDFNARLEEFQNSNKKDFDFLLNKNINDENSFRNDLSSLNNSKFTPVHLVKKSSELYYNPSDFDIDLNYLVENKMIYAQTIALFWNQNLYEAKFLDGSNILSPLQNCTVRDYFLQNIHKFDISFKNTIESIEFFYLKNNNLYEIENFKILKQVVEDQIDDSFTRALYEKTRGFENSGDKFKDINDLLDSFIKDVFK